MPRPPFAVGGEGADDFPEGGPRSISPLMPGGAPTVNGPRFPGAGGGFGRPPPPFNEFQPQYGEHAMMNGGGKLPTSPMMPPNSEAIAGQHFPNLQVS